MATEDRDLTSGSTQRSEHRPVRQQHTPRAQTLATGTSGDDSDSNGGTETSDGGNSASGDGNKPSTAGNGTEAGPTGDDEPTGTTSAPGQPAGTASEPDAGNAEWIGLPEVSGFGQYLLPSAAAFALFTVMALIGGVAYQRRLR